jgi:hypothetical protein
MSSIRGQIYYGEEVSQVGPIAARSTDVVPIDFRDKFPQIVNMRSTRTVKLKPADI